MGEPGQQAGRPAGGQAGRRAGRQAGRPAGRVIQEKRGGGGCHCLLAPDPGAPAQRR